MSPSRLPGTIVHEMARRTNGPELRIGHPAGVIETESLLEGGRVTRATLGRTARRIMEGLVYLPEKDGLPEKEPA